MSLIAIIAVIVIGLLLVTMFSKDLRNKLLEVIDKVFSTALKKAPVALDLVADPLKEKIAKIKGE
jgi:hypothetical protein